MISNDSTLFDYFVKWEIYLQMDSSFSYVEHIWKFSFFGTREVAKQKTYALGVRTSVSFFLQPLVPLVVCPE